MDRQTWSFCRAKFRIKLDQKRSLQKYRHRADCGKIPQRLLLSFMGDHISSHVHFCIVFFCKSNPLQPFLYQVKLLTARLLKPYAFPPIYTASAPQWIAVFNFSSVPAGAKTSGRFNFLLLSFHSSYSLFDSRRINIKESCI